jgi:hypothetical protein
MALTFLSTIQAQGIIDTSPGFATDTAAAWARSTGGLGGGSQYMVGGWPSGYSVRLAGQNNRYPFSAYGTPRQFGAHDHGFQHVRHPDQARYNQFGRNHWVINPIFPCAPGWGSGCVAPWPPVCVPYRPICYPYPIGIGNPWLFPGFFRPPVLCWDNWGWNSWGHSFGGFGGWANGGFAPIGFGAFQGQGVFAGAGFGGLGPDAWSGDMLSRPGSMVVSPTELPLAPGVIADSLIQHRAADVVAQHRAVAEMEAARRRPQQPVVATRFDPLGRAISASSEPELVSKDGQVYSPARPERRAENKAKNAVAASAAESLSKRRAAQAEAERQRILDSLRQK